ncbi:biosynthetic-type acetolactate synthase large subunit [Candidatus Aerophobetes bacterium]|uniref:Acetolactate synthase n=1 Tax=Aerophobetes bacterium TaxID=2030807 RepID=A0A662DGJ6_UNCAE|nr:MAG: biosynthetic-type acetolactate synthase large subunit [Candidatus Aerophobetes bacterium]
MIPVRVEVAKNINIAAGGSYENRREILKKRTGAEIVIEALIKEGVDTVFGYPGGAVIPIYDVLYDTPRIRHIITRHEQAACHAADGYARATGRVGVCIATSGPGATNLVTGLATAYMDSIPVVALTGQVPTYMIGNDAFQEANITGITYSITKHNYLVKNVDELPCILREAFYIARSGRPGPVLVDLPKDVQNSSTSAPYPDEVKIRSYNPHYEGNPKQIKLAAREIDRSERPVIYAGGGIISSGASKELYEFAHHNNIPVTTTLMALGAFPEDDPLSLKMLGMHGTRYANYAICEADLIIAIGARFDDRITGKVSEFAPKAKIIHIDIDPTAISKSVKVDIPIVGDAKKILSRLTALTRGKKREAWHRKIAQWKEKYPLRYDKGKRLKPQFVVEKIYQVTKGKAIICTEVGQNQMWAAQFYCYTRPRNFISSGGLGTMGYGFPAAIGAQIGRPDEVVFDIAGDGSFQMNIQELATVSKFQIPVKVAILNNGYLGMVRQWQQLFYKGRYSQVDISGVPDFVKVAKAYGVEGIRVKKMEEVEPALKKALSIKGPVVMDFRIDREENVYPMVPAGAALYEIIDGLA